ncbi:MAG: hypothetical protein E7290_07595 [Lachnospiraceae bacterium]|nr:hypothetical protein [Lachnospiraceae bacterium]
MKKEKAQIFLIHCIRKIFYIISFLLPFFAMLGICKETGTYPFGEQSWLVCDMDNQYISYFSYFRHALKENGFFYTFSKTLGGDMFGFTAYYLMSPWNMLLLLVQTHSLHDMVAWISLIKIGLCGLTFFILVNYNNEKEQEYSYKKSMGNLIFSTAYGLMTYNIFYVSNIMWFDAIYMLPLVVLGIHRVVKEKKYLLYILSLAYAVITNFYIGYMVCIFSALYFVYFCICECKDTIRERAKITGLFTIGSLLAGGLSMWCLLPAKTSLDGIKAEFSLKQLTWDKNFVWSDFFVKLFPGSTEDLMAGLPNIYCGVVILFFAIIFFLCRNINWKKKIGIIGLFVVMFFSFYIQGANLIWHGFNTPIGFPYRNSFIFSFIMILIAREGFFACIDEKVMVRLLDGFGSGAIIVALAIWMQSKSFHFLIEDTYKITFIAVGIGVFIVIINQRLMTYAASVIAVAFLLYETWINGVDIFANRGPMILSYLTLSIDQVETAANLVQETDDSLYRMEKNFNRNTNDNMMFGISGLSHYSSTEKPATKQFMQALGFRNNGNWVDYNRGSTLSAESFLGVKYLLTKTALEEPYVYVDKIDGTYIYENPNAFSMAFLTDAFVEGMQTELTNTFEFQNKLLEGSCNIGNVFIQETEYTTTMQNMALLDGYAVYQQLDPNQEAYVEYTFTVKEDMPIYVYLNTIDMRLSTIHLNGVDTGKYFAVDQYDAIAVDDYLDLEYGDTLTIRVTPQTGAVIITDVLIYYEDVSRLEKAQKYQDEGAITLKKISDSYLEATFDNICNRNKILFTIPYDEGWHAYIDGREVELYPAAGAFMAILGVEEGEHTLTLKYVPKNLILGSVISLISLAILVLLIWYECKKNKDENLLKKILIFFGCMAGIVLVYLLSLLICATQSKLKVVEQDKVERESIILGTLEQDGNTENGAEPIEWIVLEEKDGKVLVMSKQALAYLPYATAGTAPLWEDSYVRMWLNQEFYSVAFTDEERDRIQITMLDNTGAGSQFVEGGIATEDYLFLLSRNDVKKYFGVNTEVTKECFYSQDAIAEATEMSVLQSQEANKEYYTLTENVYDKVFKNYGYTDEVIGTHGCNYWLRNPGRYASVYAATVGGNGNVYDVGTLVTEYGYVRPVMWIEKP